MSTIEMRAIILREIDKLNDRIDRRILRGRSYAREAARHRMLLRRLREIDRKHTFSGRRIPTSRSRFAFV